MAKAPIDGTELVDLKLAHAVKVNNQELTYMNRESFDLHMHNNLIISITKKFPSNANVKSETVYTSVMNAISWRK